MNTAEQTPCCNTQPVEQIAQLTKVRPQVDLIESENEFVMTVEMPGVDQSGVEVSIEKNVVSISGKTNFSIPEGYRPVWGEPAQRQYERSFRLSDDVNQEGIDAEIKHGVLTLKFPKSQGAQRSIVTVRNAAE